METPMSDDKLVELESRAERANAVLRAVLHVVQADTFAHPEVRSAVEDAARLTHWKRTPIPDDMGEWDAAFRRADALAKETGRPHLVLFNRTKTSSLVCMPAGSFERDGAFRFDKRDIVYFTKGAIATGGVPEPKG